MLSRITSTVGRWLVLLVRLVRRLLTSASTPEIVTRVGRRASGRLREGLQDALDEAQAATTAMDWPAAVSRWDTVVRRYGPLAPPKAHARLAVAHRESGDLERAREVLEDAREAFPDDLNVAMEWAQLEMVVEDFQAASTKWTQVVSQFGADTPAKAYGRLALANRELGRVDVAEAILEEARGHRPDDVDLAMEWAQLALVREDFEEALRRFGLLVDLFGDDLPTKGVARLAIAHRELGDLDEAERVLAEARATHPDDPELEMAWAQLALVAEDHDEAFRRWYDVLDRHEAHVDTADYSRLATAHRRLGDVDRARAVVDRGLARHPHDLRLLGDRAEIAMVLEDWGDALRRWADLLDMRARSDTHDVDRTKFPRRASTNDWYEVAWREIVRDWEGLTADWSSPPPSLLFRALGRTLRNAGLYADAERLLAIGERTHPGDEPLAWDHLDVLLLRAAQTGADGADVLARLRDAGGTTGRLADRVTTERVRLEARLTRFAEERPTTTIGRVHLLNVPTDSLLELACKSGRYVSRPILEETLAALADRDQWEEMRAPTNLMVARATEAAERFGKRFEDLPYLPAATYAEAAFFSIFHELVLHTPVARLSAEIATRLDGSSEPVFIEVPSTTFRYLDGYTFSEFDLFYLYTELRSRGVNAFLVNLDRVDTTVAREERDVRRRRLSFRPGARAMRPRGDLVPSEQPRHDDALVPAGVRSVRRVAAAIGDPLVYTSGSVVKEFAYDRSITQEYPVVATSTIHGSAFRMPAIDLDLHPVLRLDTELPNHDTTAEGTVEVSSTVEGDWWEHLDAVLHEFFVHMSRRCYAEVASRGITTAHVCDHLFPEGVLFADATRALGGKVVLWPHSANPVHVDVRRPGSFDEVHAVTRQGAAIWREAHPGVTVHHEPDLMLDPPVEDVEVDPDRPLSVVIIGGRSVFRHLPLLDRRAHATTYERFFAGLESLQQRRDVDVWFKPRGLTGEHEMWMVDTVGMVGRWRRVLEHPLRLDLPNPLFVSISMGSSALLEGLSRGIPGLVVRDFPVRDYTTLDDDAFPTLPTDEALALIESCADVDGRRRLLDDELAYYRAELHGDRTRDRGR